MGGGGSKGMPRVASEASLGPSSKSGSSHSLGRTNTDTEIDLDHLSAFLHKDGFVDDGMQVPPHLGAQLLASLPPKQRGAWTKFFTEAVQAGGDTAALRRAAAAACEVLAQQHNVMPRHGSGAKYNQKQAAKAAVAVATSVAAAATALKWPLDGLLAHGLAAAEAEAAADEESVWTDMSMEDYAALLAQHLGPRANPPARQQSVRTRALLVRALQALSDATRQTFPPATGVRHALRDDCFLSLATCQLMRCMAPFLLDKGQSPAALLREYARVDNILFREEEGDGGGGGAPLLQHVAVLDHAGKALFLNLHISNHEPIDLVLSRETVFEDLVAALRDDASRPLQRPSVLTLRAYFRSEYGKKRVGGQQVEEGEGLGPRKEFYSLASQHLGSSWKGAGTRPLEGAVTVEKGGVVVTGAGTRFLRDVQKGMRISLGVGDDDKPQNESGVVVDVVSDTELRVERRFQSAHAAESAWLWRHAEPLFVYSKTQEAFWYNAALQRSPEMELQYEVVGRLVAAALADRCKLDIVLSEHLFAHLLASDLDRDYRPTAHDLQLFDAGAAEHVLSVHGASAAQLADMIEEADLGTAGVTTAEQYVEASCRDLMLDSVRWQADAVHRGFQLGAPAGAGRGAGGGDDGGSWDGRSVWAQRFSLAPRELQTIVCGVPDTTADFDFRKVFRVVEDPELQQCHPLREALWATIDGLDRVQKRKLLHFITGVDRLPSAGTEMMKIEMPFMAYSAEEHEKTLLMMPQAHTCDNILELPNYWQSLKAVREGQGTGTDEAALAAELRALIHDKVETAFSLSDGFGLDMAFS